MADDIISKVSGNPLSPKFLAQTGVAALFLLVLALHIIFPLDLNGLTIPANLPVIFIGTLVIFSSITLVSTFPYIFWIFFGRLSDWMVSTIVYSHLSNGKTIARPFAGLVRTFSNGFFFEESRHRFSIRRDNFIVFSMKVGHLLSSFHSYKKPYDDISYLVSSIIVVAAINILASVPQLGHATMMINVAASLVVGFLLLLAYTFITVLVYLDSLRIAYEVLLDEEVGSTERLAQEEVLIRLKRCAKNETKDSKKIKEAKTD